MLATIDLDDHAPFEADEIKNKGLKRYLSAKFEKRQSPVAEKSPHGRVGVGRVMAHLLCESADALGGWSMAWRLRHEPLTRRGARATLSPRGGGETGANPFYPRIGISTYSAPFDVSLSCTNVGEPGSASFSTATSPSIWAAMSSRERELNPIS